MVTDHVPKKAMRLLTYGLQVNGLVSPGTGIFTLAHETILSKYNLKSHKKKKKDTAHDVVPAFHPTAWESTGNRIVSNSP